MSSSIPASEAVWKWVAAILFAVMLAGSPGIYQALTAPSRAEVELIRERQQTVLQRLAATEQLLAALRADISRLEEQMRIVQETINNQGYGPYVDP